jgi:hypothetical protein
MEAGSISFLDAKNGKRRSWHFKIEIEIWSDSSCYFSSSMNFINRKCKRKFPWKGITWDINYIKDFLFWCWTIFENEIMPFPIINPRSDAGIGYDFNHSISNLFKVFVVYILRFKFNNLKKTNNIYLTTNSRIIKAILSSWNWNRRRNILERKAFQKALFPISFIE